MIIGGISICGIAILYRSLTTAYGIQRYTGCRTVGHRGRAGGGLATLSDGQRCGAGAAHQTGAGASRHAAEVGGDGIASYCKALCPHLIIQCQRGGVGAVGSGDIGTPQLCVSIHVTQPEVHHSLSCCQGVCSGLLGHGGRDGDGGAVRCCIVGPTAKRHRHLAGIAHIAADSAVDGAVVDDSTVVGKRTAHGNSTVVGKGHVL